MSIWGVPKIRGTFLGGPYKKDYSIMGSISGYPNFGKLPSWLALRANGYHLMDGLEPPIFQLRAS